jgi:hypothetical protein
VSLSCPPPPPQNRPSLPHRLGIAIGGVARCLGKPASSLETVVSPAGMWLDCTISQCLRNPPYTNSCPPCGAGSCWWVPWQSILIPTSVPSVPCSPDPRPLLPRPRGIVASCDAGMQGHHGRTRRPLEATAAPPGQLGPCPPPVRPIPTHVHSQFAQFGPATAPLSPSAASRPTPPQHCTYLRVQCCGRTLAIAR